MIRVILADDEPKVSQLICNLVDWSALGMQVMGIAANGLEALDLVARHQPHLLLTDIRMPGCDGLELVKRAKALNPGLDIIIISGYRYFEYAQTAIQYGVSEYLLKPVNQQDLNATLEKMREKHLLRTEQLSHEQLLQKRLEGDTQRRREGLLRALEQGRALPATLAEANGQYALALEAGCLQLCLIKLDGNFDTLNEGARTVIGDKSAPILREAFAPLCLELEVYRTATLGTVLLNYTATAAREIRRAARAALDEIRVQNDIFPGVVFTMVLSPVCEGIQALPGAYNAARLQLANRLVEGAGSLMDSTRPTSRGVDVQIQRITAEAVRGIEQALELQDAEAVAAAVRQLSQSLPLAALDGETLAAIVQEVFSSTLVLLRKVGLPLAHGEAAKEEFLARADVCATAKGLLGCLSEGIDAVVNGALAQKQGEEAKPIRVAKQYILENYMRPITLEEVSGVAGFNASYFSSLFKKETGQNFLEFISEVRMNRAKELLRDTDLGIARICEAVGYVDLKYFTKSFKKATGVKPGEFRKLYS